MDLYGPPLPPGFKNSESSEDESGQDSDTSNSGKGQNHERVYGPTLPGSLKRKHLSDSETSEGNDGTSNFIGPVLPPGAGTSHNCDEEGSDAEVTGPSLASYQEDVQPDDVVANIEKRAVQMKDKLDSGISGISLTEEVKREEWMVVPDMKSKNQLGALTRTLAPGAKKKESKDKKHHRSSEKDKKTEEELKKYNKSKRSESLLEMHQKKKKDKKSSSKPKERKAFDREEMAVRFFSKDQVNSVIDKAKYLNSRFAAGASHFL